MAWPSGSPGCQSFPVLSFLDGRTGFSSLPLERRSCVNFLISLEVCGYKDLCAILPTALYLRNKDLYIPTSVGLLVAFLLIVTQYPGRSSLRGEGRVLTPSSRGSSLLLWHRCSWWHPVVAAGKACGKDLFSSLLL